MSRHRSTATRPAWSPPSSPSTPTCASRRSKTTSSISPGQLAAGWWSSRARPSIARSASPTFPWTRCGRRADPAAGLPLHRIDGGARGAALEHGEVRPLGAQRRGPDPLVATGQDLAQIAISELLESQLPGRPGTAHEKERGTAHGGIRKLREVRADHDVALHPL